MAQTTAELTAGAVRAELARRRISGRELAKALGWARTTTSRRLNGATPFDIEELATVANFLNLPVSALVPTSDQAQGNAA